MRKKLFIILTITWMAIIFYMSNQPADISSEHSSSVINLLSSLPLVGNIIDVMIANDIAQFVVRKGAHMFSYAVLATLAFMSMYDININIKNTAIKSVMIAFIYALTDELHQLFIPGRSGEFRDVLVDTTGAIIGICFVYLIIKNTKRKYIEIKDAV